MKRVLVLCVALSMLVLPAGGAAADPGRGGNSEAAHACQKEGFQVLERADGTAFADTGACVSYAARGGVLQRQPVVHLSDISLDACNALVVGYELGGVRHDLYSKPTVCQAFSYPDVAIGPFPSAEGFRIYLRDVRCGVTYYDDGGHGRVTGNNPYTVDITDAGFDCEFAHVDRPPTARGNLHLVMTIVR